MTRFLTASYNCGQVIKVFTEGDDISKVDYEADDWVWQFAETKEQAIQQHDTKMDAYTANPTKQTY